ncbi:hypothetical protein GCM10025880_40930 [Methylorubrum aminovorans]|nr:hypothetical protein GCM10025880_40930 [Methylorubrum aminovorans]
MLDRLALVRLAFGDALAQGPEAGGLRLRFGQHAIQGIAPLQNLAERTLNRVPETREARSRLEQDAPRRGESGLAMSAWRSSSSKEQREINSKAWIVSPRSSCAAASTRSAASGSGTASRAVSV